MSPGRDLYKIADDFASLLRVRDIIFSEGGDTSPIDGEIAEYFSHDITASKIDTVIGALRHAEVMESAAKAEAERCSKMAKSYATQREWLKGTVQRVMEMAGTQRLEGKTAGYLLLKGNGGKPAVEITDASLVDEALVQYQGTISGRAWGWLRSALGSHVSDNTPSKNWDYWSGREDVQMERIPHKGQIAAALEKPCGRCGGTGERAAASIDCPPESCDDCGGTKKASVLGARFAERQSHVECK